MSMANENEPIYVMDSPLRDDDNNGVGYEGKNGPLKKGPWTIAEDLILAAYVANHGEGNWNTVQRHTELARCGKSCRLRWTNHLRPDLKKGAFTPEEERRVVELHAQMGNKWARMVAELPGRTDNEIKNFWNTRIKRRQRAGLPIYPPDVLPDPLNENQQNNTSNPSSDFMQNNNIDIPPLEFKNLEFNQQHLYPPLPLNMPSSSLMAPNLHSSYPNNAFLSTFHPSKRLKGSNGLFPDILNAALSNFQPSGSQYQTAQPFNVVSSASTYDSQNANISNTAKLEFPSFQCQLEGWSSSSSPMTSLDSINILTQTPETEQNPSCDISPKKSGLLEEVLLESKLFEPKTINNSNSASDMAVDDMLDNTYHDFFGTDWEIDGGFLSMFTGNSLDEHQQIVTAVGGESEAPPPNLFPAQSVNGIGTSSQNISSRPDVLLGSDFFSSMHTTTNDQVMLKDAIETVLADDLSLDFTKAETSLPPGHQQDSCAWNNAMSSSYSLVPQFDEM